MIAGVGLITHYGGMALLPSPGRGRRPGPTSFWQAYAITAVSFFVLAIVAAALDVRAAAMVCYALCAAYTLRFCLHYARRQT